jgi:hypothetical protein
MPRLLPKKGRRAAYSPANSSLPATLDLAHPLHRHSRRLISYLSVVRRDHGGLLYLSVLGRRHGENASDCAIDCAIDVAGVVPALESCLANGSDRAAAAAETTRRKNSSTEYSGLKVNETLRSTKLATAAKLRALVSTPAPSF